jgi:predicted RND superfamily exporter protein
MTKLFALLSGLSVRRPRTVLALLLLALGLSGAALVHLPIHTSNLDLIDQELPEVKRFLDFAHEFGTPNVLVVTFEGADETALQAAVDELGPQFRALPGVRTVIDRVPYDPAVLRDVGADPYLASEKRDLFMVFVQPSDPHSRADTIAPLIEGVRGVLAAARLTERGVKPGMTGVPVYAIDDRDVIQHDMSKLSFLSFGLIAVLFVTAFRSLRRPLLAMIALFAGVLLTAGLIRLFPGHLTLLSAFFASTLFGLGIDYAIHIINRVEEFIAGGTPEREAIPQAVAAQANELATAAITTAFGFYAMRFSGFRGFEELGLIAGSGVLICLLVMITALPALLTLIPGRWRGARPFTERKLGRLLHVLQHPLLAGLLILLILGGLALGGPGFDNDYLNLEPHDSEAVRLERAIAAHTDFSTQFAVFVTDSRDRAEQIANRAMDDATVGEVRSILDLEMLQDAAPDHAPFPDYFRAGFLSSNGNYAVYAYPRGNVWDPAGQKTFVEAMRTIDPAVTGMPFLGSFMVARSQRALYVTAGLCSLLLLITVAVDLRRPLLIALAVAPVVLTVLALRGLMTALQVPLNPLNVMALPIVIGIAVDNGVYLVHRFLAEQGDLFRTLAGTGRSVLMTSSTTMAGFGALMLTSHRGLASFAIALTLGVGAALVVSLLVLPQLLRVSRPWLSEVPPTAGGDRR